MIHSGREDPVPNGSVVNLMRYSWFQQCPLRTMYPVWHGATMTQALIYAGLTQEAYNREMEIVIQKIEEYIAEQNQNQSGMRWFWWVVCVLTICGIAAWIILRRLDQEGAGDIVSKVAGFAIMVLCIVYCIRCFSWKSGYYQSNCLH